MKISVYSLKQVLFQGDAKSLTCQTSSGEITILDNHETLITSLVAGDIKIIDKDNKEHFFEIKSGFLEVKSSNEVRCIVE
jgi:F-type H+-transporting ATPase subunit epsilon